MDCYSPRRNMNTGRPRGISKMPGASVPNLQPSSSAQLDLSQQMVEATACGCKKAVSVGNCSTSAVCGNCSKPVTCGNCAGTTVNLNCSKPAVNTAVQNTVQQTQPVSCTTKCVSQVACTTTCQTPAGTGTLQTSPAPIQPASPVPIMPATNTSMNPGMAVMPGSGSAVYQPVTAISCTDTSPGHLEQHYSVAMAYVPWQQWQRVYSMEQGFRQGTIFPDLDLPFQPRRCRL